MLDHHCLSLSEPELSLALTRASCDDWARSKIAAVRATRSMNEARKSPSSGVLTPPFPCTSLCLNYSAALRCPLTRVCRPYCQGLRWYTRVHSIQNYSCELFTCKFGDIADDSSPVKAAEMCPQSAPVCLAITPYFPTCWPLQYRSGFPESWTILHSGQSTRWEMILLCGQCQESRTRRDPMCLAHGLAGSRAGQDSVLH